MKDNIAYKNSLIHNFFRSEGDRDTTQGNLNSALNSATAEVTAGGGLA